MSQPKIALSADSAKMLDRFAAIARSPGAANAQDFATLLTQVAGETNFKPNLKNPITGAAGPFQFVKNTWLSLLRQHGVALGVKPDIVQQIKLDPKGKPHVDDPGKLQEILDLRHDVELATKVAGKYLDENRTKLTQALHRQPNEAEIHIAFLLGTHGATKLLQTAASAPDTPVDTVIGAAYRANKSLFQDKNGHLRTAGEAVAALTRKHFADKARVAAYTNPITHPTHSAPKGKLDV